MENTSQKNRITVVTVLVIPTRISTIVHQTAEIQHQRKPAVMVCANLLKISTLAHLTVENLKTTTAIVEMGIATRMSHLNTARKTAKAHLMAACLATSMVSAKVMNLDAARTVITHTKDDVVTTSATRMKSDGVMKTAVT